MGSVLTFAQASLSLDAYPLDSAAANCHSFLGYDRPHLRIRPARCLHQALTGNPLVVLADARGLSDKEMQALAREMNLQKVGRGDAR